VLAHILRTDKSMHRRLPAISDHGLAIKALARQHQEAIWALHQTGSRLHSVLLEFYPQALKAFPRLTHRAALCILAAVSTPSRGKKITRSRIVALLRRSGRRNDPSLVEQIFIDLRQPALQQPVRVEEALGLTVRGLIDILRAMAKNVEDLEAELSREFDQHLLAPILRSAPGLGPVLAARVLAEIGDDATRFANANGLRAFAGTAPITRASGRSHYVKARKVRNRRLGDACHWWAFATLTKSTGARAQHGKRRATGEHHNAALRNLANTLLGRLWWCLTHGVAWDENAAWHDPSVVLRSAAA
jgi:transposase